MASPSFCRKCGVSLSSDSRFCPSCGTAQHTTGSDETSQSAPSPLEGHTGKISAGSMLHGRYRLLHTLGQGGMGAVYVAQDTQLGDRLVAVKEMSMSRLAPQDIPRAVEQFKQEAHLLASLHHPNLPVIYDHFSENNRWYLSMSFIEGETLQAYLNAVPENKLPIKEVVRIGVELCSVLEYLHTHKPQIIFRDLKPLNVMMTPRGQIYLIDFGIARHFKQEQTKDTAYYYSVGYAPPEQYGQSQTGPRSDIYSLGVTLYQMLTGHNPASRPFYFPNLQLLDPTIPIPLANLVAQMLDMSEQQRPASMEVVKAELEKVLNPPKIAPTEQAISIPQPEKPMQAAQSKDANLTWKQVRISIITFFKKPSIHIALWIGFVALSVFYGIIAVTWPSPSGYAGTVGTVGAIGATVIGIVLLLARKRRLMSMIGGFLLVVFCNVALLGVSSQYSYYYRLYSWFYYSSQHDQYNLSQIVIFCWLFVGTSIFLRVTNFPIRMAFGTALLIAGIFITTQSRLEFQKASITETILGALILLMPVIKITRNSLRARKRTK